MERVLIIDDSSFQRNMLRRIIEGAGYTVITAANGREGLEQIETGAPDVVLCDLLMPELGGRELLEILREKKSPVSVIIVTADIQKSVRQQCMDLGAVAFVNKPPDKDELLGYVRKALENEAQTQQ